MMDPLLYGSWHLLSYQSVPPFLPESSTNQKTDMTERWVSNKKYYCTYCKIYLADNKQTRSLHEGGLKHKGNVERYLSEVRKKEEEKKRTDDYTRRILETVERKAAASFQGRDSGAVSASAAMAARLTGSGAGSIGHGSVGASGPKAVSERPRPGAPVPASASQKEKPVVINAASGLGEWTVVDDPPPPPKPAFDDVKSDATGAALAKPDTETYEEDEDKEGVSGFKISEKRARASEDVDETVTFKKKKKKPVK